MAELDPLELTTRKEKIVVVTAVAISVIAHVLVIFGGFRNFWPDKKNKEKQMMVVRRIPDSMPQDMTLPSSPPESKQVFRRKEAVVDKGKPPEPSKGKKGREKSLDENLPKKKPDDSIKKVENADKENTISVFTDLNDAFFRLEGPTNYKGAGTFWEKNNMPTGEYKITFGTVEGYETPEPQASTLQKGGAVIFVGRYTKLTQISVDTNLPKAKFKIIRPDGQYMVLEGQKSGAFESLPLGNYTIIFDDMPGWITPSPQSRNLLPGGHLAFSGYYSLSPGSGTTVGGGELKKRKLATRRQPSTLDRRIKMVVKSYPESSIEEYFRPITYPEKVIKRSNYQEGWCQVYIILSIDESGNVGDLSVERPKPSAREQFTDLVETVKNAVRNWEFDQTRAEVHVDVRFFVEK